MPVSQCRSLVQDDPCALWLEWYGDQHGFAPVVSKYSFNDFLFQKGKEFEAAWLHTYCDHTPRVCEHDGDARLARKLKITFEMMNQGVPVIIHPTLWWAPEQIYGVPDVIALSTWLEQNFPNALPPAEVSAGATSKRNGHYLALDIKIKSDIDDSRSKEAQPPVAPARIAGGATNDNVFYLQAILDAERLVEIQMFDGREILSDSASRFDLREGFHRLVAIHAGLVPLPQRLFIVQSDAEPVSHEALPSQCIQRHVTSRIAKQDTNPP